MMRAIDSSESKPIGRLNSPTFDGFAPILRREAHPSNGRELNEQDGFALLDQ